MSNDIDMAEIIQLFIEESMEGLGIMESGLLNLDPGAADPETVNTIFRAAHSIKGGGATFGFIEVSDFAHHVETLLDKMREGQQSVTPEGIDLLLSSVDCIRQMVDSLSHGDIDTTRAKELEVELRKMLDSAQSIALLATESAAVIGDAASAAVDVTAWKIYFKPAAGLLKSCIDPLLILLELKKLGKLQVISAAGDQLLLGDVDPEQSQLAWQLELRGGVSRSAVEEAFASITDECELVIEAIEASASKTSEDLPARHGSAALTEQVPAADVSNNRPAEAPDRSSAGSREASSIRVNIDKVDALINLVGELVITQSMLSRFDDNFDSSQIESLREGLTQLSRNTRELQESVMGIRMLPINFAFNRFPRLVRDSCKALSKKVELRVSGEHTELDKTVLEKIGDPLVHLVRNSLDHGIETPEQRLAAGKPETGVLELKAYHEGGNIVIEVADDGAGIDKKRVLSKARERGLVGPDEQLSDERINNLIFMAGFSTAEVVSDMSGRGVGMDVVRRNISDLGGLVSVRSEAGVGSTFTIRLPLTMAILDGQLVRVGSQIYIISVVSIVETIQTTEANVNRIAGASELFQLRDEYLPVLRLHELFGIETESTRIEQGLLVACEANGQRVGIFVDDLLEQQQVVIKSLEANYRHTRGISGATILGDGAVALIIDVAGLIQLFFDRATDKQSTADIIV